jgi:hypothetical protein
MTLVRERKNDFASGIQKPFQAGYFLGRMLPVSDDLKEQDIVIAFMKVQGGEERDRGNILLPSASFLDASEKSYPCPRKPASDKARSVYPCP